MRTAALPTFRKLYGKIEQDLSGGTYTLSISNLYDVSAFDGKKKIVLSTTNALGGKNDFLGCAYVVVGAICLALAILFGIQHLRRPRELGDPQYLKWN